jgi:hypothetical protein
MVRRLFLPPGARFFSCAMGLACIGVGLRLGSGGVGSAWLGVSFLVIGLAHHLRRPQLLGKRSDGRFHPLGALVHAPFLAASWLGWQLRRRGSEPVWNEVAPGIFVGRRAGKGELPPGDPLVVDLTCELFAERGGAYRCLPTLDGCAPEAAGFRALVAELAAHEGPIFIHCAAGHGRSATVAAGVMLARKLVATVDEAEAAMQAKRPRIKLGRLQRALLDSR